MVVAKEDSGEREYIMYTSYIYPPTDTSCQTVPLIGPNVCGYSVITRLIAECTSLSSTSQIFRRKQVNLSQRLELQLDRHHDASQIDQLASEAHSRDIKLIIVMHDRYSLGCWGTNAYVAKYSLPTTNCQDGVPDSTVFYTNADAIRHVNGSYFRIYPRTSGCHVISCLMPYSLSKFTTRVYTPHLSPLRTGGRCDLANTIRSVLGSAGIQISTGGGTDLPTSLQSQFFSCPNLQIIALHDYNLDSSYVASHVDTAKPLALQSGKRLLYEEFGALGGISSSIYNQYANLHRYSMVVLGGDETGKGEVELRDLDRRTVMEHTPVAVLSYSSASPKLYAYCSIRLFYHQSQSRIVSKENSFG
ncbi:unnamed protein product [Somion occarium]|uniref:Uncharacterized protein n=1 Tax=Somion occarium TaxID=3059160 RepID=A0ABP1DSS1_9APHY